MFLPRVEGTTSNPTLKLASREYLISKLNPPKLTAAFVRDSFRAQQKLDGGANCANNTY